MRKLLTYLLVGLCLLVAACGGDSDTDDESQPANPSPTAEVSDDAVATPEVTEPSIAETEESEIISVSPDGSYIISVSYTLDPPEEDPAGSPPEGTNWYIVVGTLANQQGDTTTVLADHLSLIDSLGNRYSPEAPDSYVEPAMVNAELAEGESVLGTVRFAIPEGTIPVLLEWCPNGSCDVALTADIP